MKERKAQLRKDKINARRNLASEIRVQFSHEICKKLLTSDFYKNATNIMLYQSMPGEVNLSEFASHASAHGKKLFYPCCISKTEMISLHPYDSIWKTGAFGITEPDPDFSDSITPAELDLIICPCTSFDTHGNRLGMGAGYYDRFLEKCVNAHIVAVAFEVQKADRVPMDIYDKKMDAIFTEETIYKK